MRESRKTREQEVRASTSWAPPTALPDPEPRTGIVHRWIRASAYGQSDPTNVSKKMREGWEPCKTEDYPELHISETPSGNVELGGLILCRMSEETATQRDLYYENMAARQEQAVSTNYKREENPVMPLIDQRRTQVTFGKQKPTMEEE